MYERAGWVKTFLTISALLVAACGSAGTNSLEISFEGVSDGLQMAPDWEIQGDAVNEGLVCPFATLVPGPTTFATPAGEEISTEEMITRFQEQGEIDYLTTITLECDDGSGAIDISEITHMEAGSEPIEQNTWSVAGGTGAYVKMRGGGEIAITEEEAGGRIAYRGTVDLTG